MEAIILAGGLGTRLREVVKDVPKCMATVADKPFLWYLLDYLKGYDVSKVILSVGYLRSVIIDWIDINGSQFPFGFDYAVEESPLGTGGAIRLAIERTRDENVLVLNGDTFFNVNLDEMKDFHRLLPSDVTIALKPMENFSRYGNVKMNEAKQIVIFEEKKPCAKGLINGGVYMIRKDILKVIPAGTKFSFETDFLPNICKDDSLYGFEHDKYFIDIGIPEDYKRADRELKDFSRLK